MKRNKQSEFDFFEGTCSSKPERDVRDVGRDYWAWLPLGRKRIDVASERGADTKSSTDRVDGRECLDGPFG